MRCRLHAHERRLPLSPAPAVRDLFSARVLVPLALIALYVVGFNLPRHPRRSEGYPPFVMAALRFLVTGAALYASCAGRHGRAQRRRQWRNCAITGSLLLGFGNGLVCYAEQRVLGPGRRGGGQHAAFAAGFGAMFDHWPRRWELAGLLIGFVGVIVLNLGGDLRGRCSAPAPCWSPPPPGPSARCGANARTCHLRP